MGKPYNLPMPGREMFLLVVDAHSRWMEVEIVNAASTLNAVEHLYSIFARCGLQKVIKLLIMALTSPAMILQSL